MGTVTGAGYVGYTLYTLYTGHQADETAELRPRYAEIEAQQQGWTTDDIIDDVANRAKWNGSAPPDLSGAADKIVVIEP